MHGVRSRWEGVWVSFYHLDISGMREPQRENASIRLDNRHVCVGIYLIHD